MTPGATINLEIVTPEGDRLAAQVRSVTAPSVEGELGILPGHRPLLAALKTGIVSYELDGETCRLAVGSGMLEIFEDHAVLLTEHFMQKAKVDPVTARLDLKEADEAIERFDGDPASPEYTTLVGRELWAAAQLELHGDPPPPIVRTITEFEAQPVERYDAPEPAVEPESSSPEPHE